MFLIAQYQTLPSSSPNKFLHTLKAICLFWSSQSSLPSFLLLFFIFLSQYSCIPLFNRQIFECLQCAKHCPRNLEYGSKLEKQGPSSDGGRQKINIFTHYEVKSMAKGLKEACGWWWWHYFTGTSVSLKR